MDRVQEREIELIQQCPSRPQMRPIKFNSNQSPLPRLSSTPSIKYRTQGEENGSKKTVLSFLSERHSQIKEKGKRIGKENDL